MRSPHRDQVKRFNVQARGFNVLNCWSPCNLGRGNSINSLICPPKKIFHETRFRRGEVSPPNRDCVMGLRRITPPKILDELS